jgi:hypothetical protein
MRDCGRRRSRRFRRNRGRTCACGPRRGFLVRFFLNRGGLDHGFGLRELLKMLANLFGIRLIN